MTSRWQNVYRYGLRRSLVSIDTIPVGDVISHLEGPGAEYCPCKPKVEIVGRVTTRIHNSHDGRELVERHGIN